MNSIAKHPINNLIAQSKGNADIIYRNKGKVHGKTEAKPLTTTLASLQCKITSSFKCYFSKSTFITITIKPLHISMLLQFLLFYSPISILKQ